MNHPPQVALLGGGFSTDEDGLLDDWVLEHARTHRPKVCFLPTASGDAPAYAEKFLAAFRDRPDCEPSVLHLFDRKLDDDALLTETVSRAPGAYVYRVVSGGAGDADERALPCRELRRGTGAAGRLP